jgi:hypothetical protein
MLQQIRKTASSTPFKILLGLIAISFAIGVTDNLTGPSSKEIATFSDMEPITYNEFMKIRTLKVKQIQQNSNEPISEEQILSMGLNQIVIQNLVTNKLFEFLANQFDLDFSDKVLADFIRGLPLFRNDANEFDVEKFKTFLRMQNITEDEYANEVNSALARDIIMSSLISNSYISNIRTDNIISHMSETRKVEIASISLNPKSNQTHNFSPDELKNFYKENNDLFKSNEVRDICYAKLNAASAKGQIEVTDSDVQNYWNENKAEFAGQKFEKTKSSIKAKLQKENLDSWLIETSKALEDEVAGGTTLQEIAQKYNLKRICEKNISSENIEIRAEGLFTTFSEQISEMDEKAVSYPLALPNENGQILFEIAKLIPEHVKDFDSIKDQAAATYAAFLYKQNTIQKLQTFASSSEGSAFAKDATVLGLTTTPAKDYIRAELSQNVNFPPEMLVSMFASSKDKIIGPFVTDDNAYVFVIRSIGYDKKTRTRIAKETSDSIISKLREGMFEELMMHAQNASKMKMNQNVGIEE